MRSIYPSIIHTHLSLFQGRGGPVEPTRVIDAEKAGVHADGAVFYFIYFLMFKLFIPLLSAVVSTSLKKTALDGEQKTRKMSSG